MLDSPAEMLRIPDRAFRLLDCVRPRDACRSTAWQGRLCEMRALERRLRDCARVRALHMMVCPVVCACDTVAGDSRSSPFLLAQVDLTEREEGSTNHLHATSVTASGPQYDCNTVHSRARSMQNTLIFIVAALSAARRSLLHPSGAWLVLMAGTSPACCRLHRHH